MQYYNDFTAHSQATPDQSNKNTAQQQPQQLLPALMDIQNIADSELHIGAGSSGAAHIPASGSDGQPDAAEAPVAADVRDHLVVSDAQQEQGSDLEAEQAASAVDIDWNVDVSLVAAEAELDPATNLTQEIDWDIDVSGADAEEQHGDNASPLQPLQVATRHGSGPPGTPSWIVRLMDDAEARNALQNDLHELLVRM